MFLEIILISNMFIGEEFQYKIIQDYIINYNNVNEYHNLNGKDNPNVDILWAWKD